MAAGGGSIVNVTSVAGVRVWELDSAYNVSKAGVEMLTRTIAVEYGSKGVRANCLAPGVIDAGMTDTVTDPAERGGARRAPSARPHGQRRGGRRGRRLALRGGVLHDRDDPRRGRGFSRAWLTPLAETDMSRCLAPVPGTLISVAIRFRDCRLAR